jgi:hypothetical protein
MPYGQSDYDTVAKLLAPTPERVATAKEWLAENRLHLSGWSVEGARSEFVAAQDVALEGDFNYMDPAGQDRLIPHWQWVNALRYAIYDLERAGIIVSVVNARFTYDQPFSRLFSIETPQVPLGEAGQQTTPTDFATVILSTQYEPSLMAAAERDHRLALYDADLFLRRANLAAFDDRVKRCVEEALACYSNDLFLAAANMLGAASEAAWYQVGEALTSRRDPSRRLTDELAKPYPSIAAIQSYIAEDLRGRGVRKGIIDSLIQTATYWRDVRNYGMHAGEFESGDFTESSVAVQLMGATGYFAQLASVLSDAREPNSRSAHSEENKINSTPSE